MNRTGLILLVAATDAVAHPGHGLPGWIHPHVADYVFLAIAVVWAIAGVVHVVRKK